MSKGFFRGQESSAAQNYELLNSQALTQRNFAPDVLSDSIQEPSGSALNLRSPSDGYLSQQQPPASILLENGAKNQLRATRKTSLKIEDVRVLSPNASLRQRNSSQINTSTMRLNSSKHLEIQRLRRGAIGMDEIDKLKNLQQEGDKKGRMYGYELMRYYENKKLNMESLKYQRPKIVEDTRIHLDQTTTVVVEILKLVTGMIENIKNGELLEHYLQSIIATAKNQKNYIISQFLILQLAKFLQEIKKLRAALDLFKQLKR